MPSACAWTSRRAGARICTAIRLAGDAPPGVAGNSRSPPMTRAIPVRVEACGRRLRKRHGAAPRPRQLDTMRCTAQMILRRGRRACVRRAAASVGCLDERYDLPAPLSLFVIGAAAVVVRSSSSPPLFAKIAPAPPRGNSARSVGVGPLMTVPARRLANRVADVFVLTP